MPAPARRIRGRPRLFDPNDNGFDLHRSIRTRRKNMHAKRIGMTAVALLLGLSMAPMAKSVAAQGPPPGYGWDAPPQELNDIQRQGFHDGIEGARRDVENHRQPNVENREEFRHP